MIFRGLNKLTHPGSLPPDQSQDCSNVFPYDEKMGTLGPRPGRSYIGDISFSGDIVSFAPYRLPDGGMRWTVYNDGKIEDVPSAQDGWGGKTGSRDANGFFSTFGSYTSGTINNPTTTGTFTTTLSAAIDLDSIAGVVYGYQVNAIRQDMTYNVQFTFTIDGNEQVINTYTHSPSGLTSGSGTTIWSFVADDLSGSLTKIKYDTTITSWGTESTLDIEYQTEAISF